MSNTAPVSYPIQMVSDENGVIVIRVFFQDPDLSDSHSLVLNADEMKGSGTVVSDDTFHYDPGTAFDYLAPGETATDTFTYTITDSAGESTSSTVTVTVTGQNDGRLPQSWQSRLMRIRQSPSRLSSLTRTPRTVTALPLIQRIQKAQ